MAQFWPRTAIWHSAYSWLNKIVEEEKKKSEIIIFATSSILASLMPMFKWIYSVAQIIIKFRRATKVGI